MSLGYEKNGGDGRHHGSRERHYYLGKLKDRLVEDRTQENEMGRCE